MPGIGGRPSGKWCSDPRKKYKNSNFTLFL
jgi:hypothetical protein